MFISKPLVFHGKSDMISFTVSAAIQKITSLKHRFVLLLFMIPCFWHAFIAYMQYILHLKVLIDIFDHNKSNNGISFSISLCQASWKSVLVPWKWVKLHWLNSWVKTHQKVQARERKPGNIFESFKAIYPIHLIKLKNDCSYH